MTLTARRITAAVAIVAAVLAGLLTLARWVDVNTFGMQMSWSGLGGYQGIQVGFFSPMLADAVTPIGWVVVLAAVLIVGAGVLGLVDAPPLWQIAGAAVAVLACGIAAITLVAVLVDPSIMLDSSGAQIGNSTSSRSFLVTPVLFGEILLLVIMGLCGGVLAAANVRR